MSNYFDHLFSCVVYFCCVGFHFLNTKSRDWLGERLDLLCVKWNVDLNSVRCASRQTDVVMFITILCTHTRDEVTSGVTAIIQDNLH